MVLNHVQPQSTYTVSGAALLSPSPGQRRSRPTPSSVIAGYRPELIAVFAVAIWLMSTATGSTDVLEATAAVDAIQLSGPEVNWLDQNDWQLDVGQSAILFSEVPDAVVVPVRGRSLSERFVVSAELIAAESIDRGKLRMTFADGAEHTFELTPGSSLGTRLSVDGPISFLSTDPGNRLELVYTGLSGIEASEFRFVEFETDVQNRSLELNWRVDQADDVEAAVFESLILGLRYVQHREVVNETIDYSAFWPGVTLTIPQRWQNDLVGAQIGFGDSLKLTRGMLSIEIKMGAFYNLVSQSLPPLFTGITPPPPFESNGGHFSLGQQYEVRWTLPVSELVSFDCGLLYLRYSDISQAGHDYHAPGDLSELQYFGGLFSLRLEL